MFIKDVAKRKSKPRRGDTFLVRSIPQKSNCRCHRIFLIFILCAFMAYSSSAAESALLPSKFTLTGPFSRQQLLLEEIRDKQFAGQLTNEVVFTSSDSNIIRIEGDLALPVTNGSATITAKSGDFSASAQVSVSSMERTFEWSFRNHVQPVLAKNGCSSGACHGAAAGQNGFKLSLRG